MPEKADQNTPAVSLSIDYIFEILMTSIEIIRQSRNQEDGPEQILFESKIVKIELVDRKM